MLIINSDNVIIDISNEIKIEGEYVVVNKNSETIYYMNRDLIIKNVDVPLDIVPQKYLYVEENFVINPSYIDLEV
jgi:hypothetical protein